MSDLFELAKSITSLYDKAFQEGYKLGLAKGKIEGLEEGRKIALKAIEGGK